MPPASRPRGIGLNTLAFGLVLAWPVLAMFFHHDYPLLGKETLILACLLVIASLILSIPARLGFQKLNNFLLLATLLFSATLQFNLFPLALVLLAAVILPLAWKTGQNFSTMVISVCLALILGSWLDSGLSSQSGSADQYTQNSGDRQGDVIHILLDGFTGIDGLKTTPAARQFSKDLTQFFQGHGFEIHTRAYSHHAATVDSMMRAFNFRNDAENLFIKNSEQRGRVSFQENTWFDLLEDEGYPLFIYQSEAMDFCASEQNEGRVCREFAHPVLRSVHTNIANPLLRVHVLLRNLLGQSQLMTQAHKKLKKNWGITVYEPRMLDQLIRDITDHPNSAFFAHFLLPHAPNVLNHDCSIDYDVPTWARWPYLLGDSMPTQVLHPERYARLIPQLQCALGVVDTIIGTLKASGRFDASTIIIHGDHGASLSLIRPNLDTMGQISYQDLREHFSTLFAVKKPGGRFNSFGETRSLNDLMLEQASLFSGISKAELSQYTESEEEAFIYLPGESPQFKAGVDLFSELGDTGIETER